MGVTFLYTGSMMIKMLKQNGLLDRDFVQTLFGLAVLLILGEIV